MYGYLCGVRIETTHDKGFEDVVVDHRTNYYAKPGECTLYDGKKKSIWLGYIPTDNINGEWFEAKICNTCEPCNDMEYPEIKNAHYYDSYPGDCVKK